MKSDTLHLKKGITVYCGSSAGTNGAYAECARAVGRAVAASGLPLIYGGGRMGMMNLCASSCRMNGGVTLSVIPEFMVKRGWDDKESTHTIVTPDMSTRKQTFAVRSVGAIALPGGIGTFEELAELITWRQLGLYDGNIVIMNCENYYDPFIDQLDNAIRCGFMPADHTQLWEVADNPESAVRMAMAAPRSLSLHKKF